MSKSEFILELRKSVLKKELREFLRGLDHPDARYHAREAAQLEICRLDGDA